MRSSRYVSPRGLLFSVFAAVCGFSTIATSLNAQTSCSTSPCVLTSQYGPQRQGYNGQESFLVASTLSNTIKLASFSPLLVDVVPPNNQINPIYAQPLYVAGINTSLTNCSPSCNMLVVATAGGGLYAFNASSGGLPIWSRITASSGGTNQTNYFWYDDCGQGTGPSTGGYGTTFGIPFAGIIATPVIDLSGNKQLMYVTSLCQTSAGLGNQNWYVHVIDLTTGYDLVTSASQRHITPATCVSGTDNADDLSNGCITFNAWEVLQRSALLEVSVTGATPSSMIYIPFGFGSGGEKTQPYHGWIFGYNYNSSTTTLTQEFSFVTTARGTANNTDWPACSANCACPSGCSSDSSLVNCCMTNPACSIATNYKSASNWCGHAVGVWMSSRGGAALTDANGVSHAYFGTGNGAFQQDDQYGVPLNPIQNWGESIVDFTLSTSGFDQRPSQYFTGFGGVPVQPPTTSAQNPVNWTFEALSQNDLDMAVSGIMLLQDTTGAWRVLTMDKGGYGYFLQSGNLCGASGGAGCYPAVQSGQPGFASGDPGNPFPFAANLTQDAKCQDPVSDDQACHRITSLALNKAGSPQRVYYWPSYEQLTSLQLSDNSPQQPSGTPTPQVTTAGTAVTGNSTCLFKQWVVPGDQLVVTSGSPPTATALTVTAVNSDTSLTVYQSSFISTPSNFTYQGYFINPERDVHPAATDVQYPGGSVVVTSNSGTGTVIWGLVTVDNAPNSKGTLFAYDATLGWLWCSNFDTFCSSSSSTSFAITSSIAQGTFALLTVVNGHVYIPTFAINTTAGPNASCPSPARTCCTRTQCGGVVSYSGH